jgi:hypothetical protein
MRIGKKSKIKRHAAGIIPRGFSFILSRPETSRRARFILGII